MSQELLTQIFEIQVPIVSQILIDISTRAHIEYVKRFVYNYFIT